MRNNPDDLANQLVNKIKKWLRAEIRENKPTDETPVFDFECEDEQLCQGRTECAEGLLEQIKKWENENEI
jgi:hypothetical protein